MRTPVSFAVAILLLGAAAPASAMTLEEAMAAAYVGNPTLQAQRAAVRATDEQVPQALSGWRPRVTATGSVGRSWSAINSRESDLDPARGDVSLVQPLFRGFRTVNGVEAAEYSVLAARAGLTSTEQEVLLGSAQIYSDVLRDQAVVELNVANEQVLRRQLDATRDRFQVGEITRTDVSQAESRVAGARAGRVGAEAQLTSSRATFQRIVGVPPEDLQAPTQLPPLPESLEAAVARALENQPQVVAARFAAQAADELVDVVSGELLPEVSLQATHGSTWEASAVGTRTRATQVLASVTVPLYQGGAVYSRVREAKSTANQRHIQVEQAQVAAREGAIQAWEALVAARAEIESRQAQVDAADTALDGVQREAQVGARTVLDVLDAEQERFVASVELVRAQRTERVAAFQLLAAIGELTAGSLGLPVEVYDPSVHYRAVRDEWFGTDARVPQ